MPFLNGPGSRFIQIHIVQLYRTRDVPSVNRETPAVLFQRACSLAASRVYEKESCAQGAPHRMKPRLPEKVVGKGRRDPLQRVREEDVPIGGLGVEPRGTSSSPSRWLRAIASFRMLALIYKQFIHPNLAPACKTPLASATMSMPDSSFFTLYETKGRRKHGRRISYNDGIRR
jgi:hypothetical protein